MENGKAAVHSTTGSFIDSTGFFPMSYLKSKVYATPQKNMDEIERRIRRDLDNLRQNRPMVSRAVFGMIRTARLCMDRNGNMLRTENHVLCASTF